MLSRITPLLAGLLIGAGVGAAIIVGISREPESVKSSESLDDFVPNTGLAVGELAPEFELRSLDGEEINLVGMRGHPVLVNFWATWCGPCRLEMPAFQERFEQYHGDLQILAINFDESPDEVRSFVNEFGLTFDVVLDPGAKVQKLYQVRGYPTSYLIDAEGVIQVQHIGLIVESQLDEYIAQVGLGE